MALTASLARGAAGLGIAACVAAGMASITPLEATAQDDLAGRWTGKVLILGTELGFSVDFSGAGDQLSATMDIPTQMALGLPLTGVAATGTNVHFELQAGPGLAVWDGERDGDVIEGTFTQGGAAGTFTATRGDPQVVDDEPAEPLPYREQEFTLENGNVHLEGTLTLPESGGPFPVAVMVTGSGAQNRDEEILGFKPFRIIADYLTRRGVAVYRYDDRGVGGSTGNTGLSTTSDFADDALAAISALSEHAELDASQIGLIGHSEGGVVAPLAAQRSESVAFVVLIAPTSVPGSEVIYEQGAEIARVAGQSEEDIAAGLAVQRRLFEAVANGDDLNAFRTELEQMIRDQISTASDDELAVIDDIDQFVASQVNQQIAQVTSPWFRFFLTYDPATALRQTRVPVLALFGELDLQVTPKQNRGPLAEALGGNPDVTIETFPGANHLFQSASTGSPTEYASLAKEFVPGFLDLIGDWIVERTDAEGR
jgi:pimeloyl-ACP methyl ester carboxylesterase